MLIDRSATKLKLPSLRGGLSRKRQVSLCSSSYSA